MLVKLRYFKPNGTWYCDGSYETELAHLWEIFEDVRQLRWDSRLPGVNGNDWLVLVEVPKHPHNHPCMIGVNELNWVQPEIPIPIAMITSIHPRYTVPFADHLARLLTLFEEGYWDSERGCWANAVTALARYHAIEDNDRRVGIMHHRLKGSEGG